MYKHIVFLAALLVGVGYSQTAVVRVGQTNSYTAGYKQTFAPDATNPGINVGSYAGDPSSLSNGDVWYNSTTNKFRCRENGATTNCVGAGGSSLPSYTGNAQKALVVNAGETDVEWRTWGEGITADATSIRIDTAVVARLSAAATFSGGTVTVSGQDLTVTGAGADVSFTGAASTKPLREATSDTCAAGEIFHRTDYDAIKLCNDAGTGVLSLVEHQINAQTGTTYTIVAGDRGKLVTHGNGSSVAVTLPQASSSFPAGWSVYYQNTGAGTITITPTTSTIDGAASLALTQNQGALIVSNGTNYYTMRGVGGGSSAFNAITSGTNSTAAMIITTGASLDINDTVFTVRDQTDNSKKLQFELTGVSTATTRTMTIPDANTTLVGADVTQTLTNKTLVGAILDGTTSIGTGSGNDRLEFVEEATNPTCAAGNYWIIANSADSKLKKCQNGTITDLDTTGAAATSGQQLVAFRPQQNEAPSASYATLDTRNGHPVLDFDSAADENAVFSGVMPAAYGSGGTTVVIHFSATGITSGTVMFCAQWEKIDAGSQDIDSDGFAAAACSTATSVAGTDGYTTSVSINFADGSEMDSVTDNSVFRLKIYRDVSEDTAAADAELRMVQIREQ